MNILITGGTGFIGQALCPLLMGAGHQLTVLSRNPDKPGVLFNHAKMHVISSLKHLEHDAAIDVLINLSGENIAAKRWRAARKKVLLTSRVGITEELVQWIRLAKKRPKVFISGSAVGYYGDNGNEILSENALSQPGFTHELCYRWEQTALQAQQLDVRVVLLRIAPVLGLNGGMLQKLLPVFKLGMGGMIGDGQQWMPWIHMADMLNIIQYAIDNEHLNGAINACSPQPVRNEQFTQALAACLGRPAILKIPAGLIKLLMGQQSHLLLDSIRAVPSALQTSHFQFTYENINKALSSIIIDAKNNAI